MRKLIILIVLVISFCSYAQKPLFNYPIKKLDHARFIANYTLQFKEDTLNPDQKRKEDFLLFLGEEISLFIGKNLYSSEIEIRGITSRAEFQQWADNHIASKNFSRFLYRFHKNYPTGKITCYEHISAGPFLYEEEMNLFNWELTNITDTIAGNNVQKATTYFGGRSWVAWFSPDIPYNDGPYKFNGLPGLILKIYDTRLHYVFEIKNIVKPVKYTPIELEERDYYQTTKFNYFKARDNFYNNITDYAANAGIKLNDDQKATMVINSKLRNNPIELVQK